MHKEGTILGQDYWFPQGCFFSHTQEGSHPWVSWSLNGVQFISFLSFFNKAPSHTLSQPILIRNANRWRKSSSEMGHLPRIHRKDLTIPALWWNRCPFLSISVNLSYVKRKKTYWMTSYERTMLLHGFSLHTPLSHGSFGRSQDEWATWNCWNLVQGTCTCEILQVWMRSP